MGGVRVLHKLVNWLISCHISEFNIRRSKRMCIISVFDTAYDTFLLGLILLSISSYWICTHFPGLFVYIFSQISAWKWYSVLWIQTEITMYA